SISSSSASSSCGLRENRPPMLRAKALPRRRARQPAAPAGAAGAVASASGVAGGTGGVVAAGAGAGGASVAGAAASGFLRRKKLTIVGTIAQNGAHGSTGPRVPSMKRKRPARSTPAPVRGAPGAVRIVGGRWRGTRLPVADAEGLRPTPDRVRETLFNWLQPVLPGARVLDLFAGSGALGLEALSRGAREALLVERDPGLAQQLRRAVERLQGGEAVQVVNADALAFLSGYAGPPFDIAFVDPPFAQDL